MIYLYKKLKNECQMIKGKFNLMSTNGKWCEEENFLYLF